MKEKDKIKKKKDHEETGVIRMIVNGTAEIFWDDSAKGNSWVRLESIELA